MRYTKRQIVEKMDRLQERIRMLECNHKFTKYMYSEDMFGYRWWYEKCDDCGKHIRSLTEIEFLKHEIAEKKRDLEHVKFITQPNVKKGGKMTKTVNKKAAPKKAVSKKAAAPKTAAKKVAGKK